MDIPLDFRRLRFSRRGIGFRLGAISAAHASAVRVSNLARLCLSRYRACAFLLQEPFGRACLVRDEFAKGMTVRTADAGSVTLPLGLLARPRYRATYIIRLETPSPSNWSRFACRHGLRLICSFGGRRSLWYQRDRNYYGHTNAQYSKHVSALHFSRGIYLGTLPCSFQQLREPVGNRASARGKTTQFKLVLRSDAKRFKFDQAQLHGVARFHSD